MQALIHFFFELCTLRRAPQDLPASQTLFGLLILVNLFIGTLVSLVGGLALLPGVLQGAIEIALTLAVLAGALKLTRRASRLLQAATALLGVGALIGVLALLPLSLVTGEGSGSDLALLSGLMILALFIWNLVVSGHILRHTFDITLGQGTAIAGVFEFTTLIFLASLFGGQPA